MHIKEISMNNAQYEIRVIRSPRTAQELRANAVQTVVLRGEYAVKIRSRSLPCTFEDFALSREGHRSWKEAKRGLLDGAVVGKRIKRRKSWMK